MPKKSRGTLGAVVVAAILLVMIVIGVRQHAREEREAATLRMAARKAFIETERSRRALDRSLRRLKADEQRALRR